MWKLFFFWYVQDKWVVFCTLFFLSLSFSHCIVCLSSIYGSWLHLWYNQTFVSSTSYQPFAKYRCSNVCLQNFVLYYSFVIEKCCVLKMLYAVYIQTHPAGVPDPILVSCRNYDVEMLNMVFLFSLVWYYNECELSFVFNISCHRVVLKVYSLIIEY
jgi:hypothetical protein